MNAGHGVEKMGQMSSPSVISGAGVLIIGVGVGHGDGAVLRYLAHKVHRTIELGR